MTTVRWTSKGAWEHLLNKVFQTSDTLPFFAFSVGCENIDDFMYLTRGDFETSFQVTSSDDEGQPVLQARRSHVYLSGNFFARRNGSTTNLSVPTKPGVPSTSKRLTAFVRGLKCLPPF